MKPPRPRAVERTTPMPRCCRCGAVAPFGIGPPAVEDRAYFCGTHWTMLPEQQAAQARRMREALANDGDYSAWT